MESLQKPERTTEKVWETSRSGFIELYLTTGNVFKICFVTEREMRGHFCLCKYFQRDSNA